MKSISFAHHRAALIVAGGLMVGALAGTGIGAAFATNAHSSASSPSVPPAAQPFGTNSAGETFGSALGSKSIASEPDLIAARATNGKDGYVKKADLEQGSNFKSPAAAIAWSKAHANGYTIHVYASDGVTVIGQFQVGGNGDTAHMKVAKK